MISRLILFLLILSNISLGQSQDQFFSDFLLEDELKKENSIDKYSRYDFSNIWTAEIVKADYVFGIIGEDHQRLRIKILSADQREKNSVVYDVVGKSAVKGNLCEFSGTFAIESIQEVEELHLGVDDIYADSGIKAQGVLIAKYYLMENKSQRNAGVFAGKLYSKWYLTADDKIKYDDIQLISDTYMNNAFIGTWKSYASGVKKVCNWADFRVPMANDDFDVGAGEFYPNEKYHENGWEGYNSGQYDPWWK